MKYKVGDRVKVQSLEQYNKYKNIHGNINYGCETEILFTSEMSSFCGQVVTITRVRYIGCVRFYHLAEDKGVHFWVGGMFEGLVEEETKPNIIEEAKTYWDSIKDAWICPDGYEFHDENGNVINTTKIVLEKKKKEYPKTYEECCEVLKYSPKQGITMMGVTEEEEELFRKLIFLKRCRDAYWKIAGEDKGLGTSWKPDYDSGVDKFGIVYFDNTIMRTGALYRWERHLNNILDFPTEEMRDAFYENFKELINECKELL